MNRVYPALIALLYYVRILMNRLIGGIRLDINIIKSSENYLNENELYLDLNTANNILYKFVLIYNDYISVPKDYGTGDILSMMEAHVLTDIVDNPGTTVTELSKSWERTTSAISQTVRKLIKKEYVYRVNSEENASIFLLHPTNKAIKFDKSHKSYDINGILSNRKRLLKKFTEDDLKIFFSILEDYTDIIKEKTIINKEAIKRQE